MFMAMGLISTDDIVCKSSVPGFMYEIGETELLMKSDDRRHNIQP